MLPDGHPSSHPDDSFSLFKIYLNFFVLLYGSLANPSGYVVTSLKEEIVLRIFVLPSPPPPITEPGAVSFAQEVLGKYWLIDLTQITDISILQLDVGKGGSLVSSALCEAHL